METFKRPKPMWIPSRVPADINCPECGTSKGAKFIESPSDQMYRYTCKTCGAVVYRSLDELNDPVGSMRKGA